MSNSQRLLTIVALFLLVIALIVTAVIVRQPPLVTAAGGPATRGSTSADSEVQRLFYVAVAALDVDDTQRAHEKLTKLTELAPDEPAAWADLGLLELRLGQLDVAATHLEKARSLAPKDARIEALLGLVQARQGKFAESIAHLRGAVELDPKKLRARYALATQIERQAAGDSDAEAQDQLQHILAIAPNNLAVMLDVLRLAAKRGDAATVRDLLARLAPLVKEWPNSAQDQFA